MSRSRLLLSACLSAALFAAVPAAHAAPVAASSPASAPAGVTIDDLLKAQTLGDAWFSPDGRRVMFVRGMPIQDVHERGQDDEGIDRDRVMVAEVAGGAPVQVGDFAPIHANPWSPDGSGAMMLSVTDGAYSLAYWNAASGKAVVLPGRVTSSFPAFAWLGSKLAYAVVADDDVQRGARRQIVDQLIPRWHGAWTGEQPVVTVSSANSLFKSTAPHPGKLMLADLKTGQAKPIADGDFSYYAVQVSPDGRYLAAVRLTEAMADTVSWEGRRGELMLFDLSGGFPVLAHHLTDLDFADAGMAWSAKGDRLLIGARRLQDRRADTGVYEVDAGSGHARRLADQGIHFMDTSVSAGTGLMPLGWLGDRPLAVASRPGQSAPAAAARGATSDYGETDGLRLDVYDLSGPSPHALTGFSHASVRSFMAPKGRDDLLVATDGALWGVSPSGQPRRLSPEAVGTVLGFGVDNRYPPAADETAYARDAAGERVAVTVLASTGGVERRVLDLTSGAQLAAAPAPDVLASTPDLLTSVTKADERWSTAFSLKGPKANRLLMQVNLDLNSRPVAPATRFDYSYKGRKLTGWVLTPPGARSGAPLPAVVSVYGGQVLGGDPPTFSRPAALLPVFSGQLLAAHGYAVIYPSTPIEAGADTNVMATLAGECVAAVDALAAKGIVDPKRVGVTGQSFGGYSTAAILAAASDRFRAGVAMAGIYDWSFSYGLTSMSDMLTDDGRDKVVETKMVEDGQIRLGKPFWAATEAYMRNSPIYHVEDINSPLLLLHGDMDMAVTGLPNALRMYNALVRAGKHPALVRYWGEGHVSASAWAMRDQIERMQAWFDAYVRDAKPAGG